MRQKSQEKADFSARVFKISRDPQGKKISLLICNKGVWRKLYAGIAEAAGSGSHIFRQGKFRPAFLTAKNDFFCKEAACTCTSAPRQRPAK